MFQAWLANVRAINSMALFCDAHDSYHKEGTESTGLPSFSLFLMAINWGIPHTQIFLNIILWLYTPLYPLQTIS